jgi:hypothetical protein
MGRPKIHISRTLADFPAPTPMPTPCRLWQGRTDGRGYGMKANGGQERVRMHRWAWAQAYGPIPEGMVIMHLCDHTLCYRIDHLRLGTPQDNIADMVAKKRAPLGEARGNARLTDADVAKARQLYGDGHTVAQILKAIGSPACASALLNAIHRRTWRHVA